MNNFDHQISALAACPRITDVAALYFPQYARLQSSKRMFIIQIKANKKLYENLLLVGFDETALHLTPKQMGLIVDEWGEPDLVSKKIANSRASGRGVKM